MPAMKKPFVAFASILLVLGASCTISAAPKDQAPLLATTKIIFLHHSTGEVIWNGGVAEWFAA
jgi:hypothetical protein